ncbi:4a-hydroxytetrahydrobiopterin dehydratase [Patescibacteria group bacterium]|nr:4a-hydroxytetrahydrobiopterin dehydratase [Patescibacteria group bacterium]
MKDLPQKHCVPCEGGVTPLAGPELDQYLIAQPSWRANADRTAISKDFLFTDFVSGVVFITDVAHIAEEEGHHPDLNLHNYNRVTVTLSTHAIKGLSENDFILAAKIDALSSH